MNYSGAIAFIFQFTVSPPLFSHGHNLQNVPLSKAMVIIPPTTTFFFRTYLNSQEQLLKPCKGKIAQELTSDIFLKIALINPIVGNLPVHIPPGVTGIEERLGRLAFAQHLSVIWVPGACVFSLLRNTEDKLPSPLWLMTISPAPFPWGWNKVCSSRKECWAHQKKRGTTGSSWSICGVPPWVSNLQRLPVFFHVCASGIPSPRLHSHHGNLCGEAPRYRRKGNAKRPGVSTGSWLVGTIKEYGRFHEP